MSGPFFDPACLPQCASPRRGSIAGCYWLAPTTEDHDAISVAQRCELSNSSSLCRHGRTFPITNRSLTINVVQKPSSPYFNTSTLYGSQERKRKRPATPILPNTHSRMQEHITFLFRRRRQHLARAAALQHQRKAHRPFPHPPKIIGARCSSDAEGFPDRSLCWLAAGWGVPLAPSPDT